MTKTTNRILGSGASNHIVLDKEQIKEKMKPGRLIKVSLTTRETTTIKLIGNAEINEHISLKNVLCLTNFNCNLIFVSKLTKEHNCFVGFSPDKCFI